jgi:putative spermidine/putrescine transport system ATP-binding protein
VNTASGLLKVNTNTETVFSEGDTIRLYLPEDKLILVKK